LIIALLRYLSITIDLLQTYGSNWESKDYFDVWHMKMLKRMTAQHVKIERYTLEELFYDRS